jgi:hypothetical protein
MSESLNGITMKLKVTILTLLTILVLYSCNTGSDKRDFSLMEVAVDNEISSQPDIEKVEAQIERKIIKEGEISFETSNLKETESLITRSVNEMGGYVANDNIFDNEGRTTHRMTLRVPADKFDLLLKTISESAKKLDRKTISSHDVTEEFIDVEARIKTKKELESRYKELLVKAETVQDLLAIEKEIGTLRTEIESIEGRLRYLQDRVSLSSLTIEFYELTTSSFGFFSKLGRSFETGWNWLLAFLIGLIHLWPFILLIGAGLFITFRFGKKKKAN